MRNLESRLTKLERENGTGEPVELLIQTGVRRGPDDDGVVRLLLGARRAEGTDDDKI